MSVTLRLLCSTDIECLLAQFAAQGWDKPREVLEGYLGEQESGERTVVVAESWGEVAGYVTLLPRVKYAVPFRGREISEIMDFIVFEKFQRRGIGALLLDQVEKMAAELADEVCLGVGLHCGYGAAQRVYAKRGYVPEGSGVWAGNVPAPAYGMVENGDELVLYLSKKLR